MPLPRLHPRRRPEQNQGIALIAVLSFVGLLTVLALAVLNASRRHAQLVQRSFESYQLQEAADSAIRLALLELGAPPAGGPAETLRQDRTYDVFGRTISVSFDYEAGRIDLNAADEDLLTAAFAGNDFSEVDARSMAQRIIDWRDADDAPGSNGAERREYRRAGRNDGPRNGSFETVTELRQLLTWPVLEEELLDAFTVYSQSATVRPKVAVEPVMRALRWADGRRLGERDWLDEAAVSAQRQLQSASIAGEAVRLRACVDSGQTDVCRVAIVRFTGNHIRPVLVFAWYTQYE